MFSLLAYAQQSTFTPNKKALKNFEKNYAKINDNFYMSKYEVSNQWYNDFLHDLQQKGELEKYAVAIYDSSKWITKSSCNEPLKQYYHHYPAYRDYPVVNVSYEGAVLYCQWLTSQLNSREKRPFKKVLVRLPTEEEWKNAARSGETPSSSAPYPWGGPFLRNIKNERMCNFLSIGDQNIHLDSEKNQYIILSTSSKSIADGSTYTMSVQSFHPNEYGIYNISGNVAEMTAEKGIARGGSYISPGYDVRIDSEEKYNEPSAHIGFRFCVEVIEK